MWRPSLIVITSAFCFTSLIDAEAGQCTQEIESYQKELSKTDAGMGPTDPATSATTSANTTSESEANETPATAAMNESVEGKATSPEDVQQQNQGQPTAADAAQAGGIAPAAGPEAEVTLAKARELDQAGKEEECMGVMETLKAP
jgi:hypothetical protein